jgi:hypothetical protein
MLGMYKVDTIELVAHRRWWLKCPNALSFIAAAVIEQALQLRSCSAFLFSWTKGCYINGRSRRVTQDAQELY